MAVRTHASSVWRDVEKQQIADKAKRSVPPRFDPQEVLAKHLAAHFTTSKWTVLDPEAVHPARTVGD